MHNVSQNIIQKHLFQVLHGAFNSIAYFTAHFRQNI